MRVFKHSYAIGIFILVAIFMILPVFNVNAGENDNFLITVETDKEVYEVGETVEYLIKVKNISQNEAKDVSIIDELPSNIKVINTDGQVNGNKISWEKEGLLPGEEVVLHLSIQLNEVTVTPPVDEDDSNDEIVPPTEGDTGDGDIPPKDEVNQETPPVSGSKPDTGYNNFIVLIMGIILTGLGYLLYKVNGKKIGKFFILMLLCSITFITTFKTDVNAENINVCQEYTHSVKINGESIKSKITISANMISDETDLDNEKDLLVEANRISKVITLQWEHIEGAVYKVERGTESGQLELLVENLSEPLLIDTEVLDDMSYHYQVSVVKNNEIIRLSNIIELKAFIDTDEDGLTDDLEKIYGTDANNPDTDGDGLSDGQEVLKYKTNPLLMDTDGDRLSDFAEVTLTLTNPNAMDTDENGILDSDEDLDEDSLTNLEEINYGTKPKFSDSDFDGLSDDEEIYTCKTNPMKWDTDEDGVGDSEEIRLGLNPLSSDTNGNGISDGDEEINIVYTPGQDELDERVIPTIEMNIPGKIVESLLVSKVEEENFYINDQVPGYIGAAYDFKLDGEFNSATLSFKFDANLFKDPEFEPAIYYIDQENQQYVRLDNQVIDSENGVVSAEVTHFSMYALLNGKKFEEVFNTDIKGPVTEDEMNKPLDIVFAIDSSGSMVWNDSSNIRIDVVRDFINFFSDTDRGAIVDFDESAKLLAPLTSDKEILKNAISKINSSGGTSLSAAMDKALEQFSFLTKESTLKFEDETIEPYYGEGEYPDTETETSKEGNVDISEKALGVEFSEERDAQRYIILLTDGEGDYHERYTQEAIAKGVKVHTIGLGEDIDEALLKKIASETGGNYYYAEKASDLIGEMENSKEETIDRVNDSNENGISDYHERKMRTGELKMFNGEIMECPAQKDKTLSPDYDLCFLPDKSDHDGDGLKDGEEIIIKSYFDTREGKEVTYFIMKSNPLLKDTDEDSINDSIDELPLHYNVTTLNLNLAAQQVYDKTNPKPNGDKPEVDLENPEKVGYCNRDWNDEMPNNDCWDVIYLHYSGQWQVEGDYGLGVLGIKYKDNVIISFRGTDINQMADWTTNGSLFLSGYSGQTDIALDTYRLIASRYPDAKIYITGHSLGGLITQEVLYELHKTNRGNMPQYSTTYNAPGFAFGKLFDKTIMNHLSSELTNYWIKYDLVGDFLGTKLGYRLGYDYNSFLIKEEPILSQLLPSTSPIKPLTGYYVAQVHGIKLFPSIIENQYRIYY